MACIIKLLWFYCQQLLYINCWANISPVKVYGIKRRVKKQLNHPLHYALCILWLVASVDCIWKLLIEHIWLQHFKNYHQIVEHVMNKILISN